MSALPIHLDRARRTPLATQIYWAIREGIESGRLASRARLPSWRDLAAQLGVSRGTVRVAYARLIAEQFAIGLGPAGTRVAERPSRSSLTDWSPEAPPLPERHVRPHDVPPCRRGSTGDRQRFSPPMDFQNDSARARHASRSAR
jgi:DNA-binding transcriptional MocR family regulator